MKRSLSAGRLFVRCVLGLLALSVLIVAGIYWNIYGYAKLFGDFTTFYAAASHITAGDTADVYAVSTVKLLYLGHSLKDFAFFLNPPTGLFILYPLGYVGFLPGLILWSLVQLALLWWVLRSDYMQRLYAPAGPHSARTSVLLGVTFLAFALQNLLYGQIAVFCTTLFIGVMALRKTRPLLAGVLLGIFSFKPQLAVLLPLLLLAEGNFKALVSAGLTAGLMIALSYLLWGGTLWRDYADMMRIRAHFMAEAPDLLFVLSTSLYAAARNAGLLAPAALMIQGAAAVLAISMAWPVMRKGEEIDKILILSLATFLVTPYSLIYDMVLLAVPAAWLLRRAEGSDMDFTELVALLLLILMPLLAVLLQISHIPYSIIAIGFALIVARRLTFTPRRG